MHMNTIRKLIAIACGAVLVFNILPEEAEAAALTACLGSAVPDISDGRYDCNENDVSGSVESGQHLFLNWHDSRGDEVRHITLDLGPSNNASIGYRGAFFADNLDGANIVSEFVQGNVYQAYLRDFTDAVDNFYIGFNLNQRSTGSGTPVSPDYNGATLKVRTLYGREFTCPFRHVDQFTATTDRVYFGAGLRVRPAWFLPCQQLPSIKHDFELLNQLEAATIGTELNFCEQNPDSPLCE